MFLEFDFVWGAFFKKFPNFHFRFSPLPGTRGTPGALGVHRIKKLHKTESKGRPILGGVPFIKKMWKFQNFVRPPGQPRLPALFSRAVGQNSKSAPNVLFASMS